MFYSDTGKEKEECIKNVIITDLGSTDKTKEIAKKLLEDNYFFDLTYYILNCIINLKEGEYFDNTN